MARKKKNFEQRSSEASLDGRYTLDAGALNSYRVQLPNWFTVMAAIVPVLISFVVGSFSRAFILANNVVPMQMEANVFSLNEGNEADISPFTLPVPIVPEDKEVPLTVFTSRNYAVDNVRSSNTMHLQKKISNGDEDEVVQVSQDEMESAPHDPAGQHLLVDIKHVDPEFLDSEQLLSKAMVELVMESGLTLLSYHCHSMEPMGVSCVGVLLESHVSFHTWPEEGVITLDLFTCGSKSLIPAVPLIEKLFGVPISGSDALNEPPRAIWVHKMRGFRKKIHPLDDDTSIVVLANGHFEMKKEIGSTKTYFQRIDIYDAIDPRYNTIRRYEESISNKDTYESINKEFFTPNRFIFLDGILQSSSHCDEAYHEVLVHPAMFTHPNPQRVAIIGGGEGATLREVLKHETVNNVKMIEIDDEMMKFSRENLPSWTDCSDLHNSTDSCFDDERADIYAEDAMEWFIDKFGDDAMSSTCKSHLDESCEASYSEEQFDVIIMDALDPQDGVPFAAVLYSNRMFWKALYNSLSSNGVMIMQLGMSPFAPDASEAMSKNRLRGELFSGLKDLNFEVMHAYEDGHSGFYGPWSYLLVCREKSCEDNLNANEALIDLEIYKRIKRTHSGKSPLKYFDGATMRSVQSSTPKAWEIFSCRGDSKNSCEMALSDPRGWNSISAALRLLNLGSLETKLKGSISWNKWISVFKKFSRIYPVFNVRESDLFDPFMLRHFNFRS